MIVWAAGATICSIFVSWLVVDQILHRKQIKKIIDMERTIEKFENPQLKNCIRDYGKTTIETVGDVIVSLQKQTTDLDESQFERLMKILLESGGHYDGVDYHLPSEYMRVYGHYLSAHRLGIQNNPATDVGYRIIVADPEEIRKDSLDEHFSPFYDWHKDNNVKLHNITRTAIKNILEKNQIEPERCATGLGIWRGQFVILFGQYRDKKLKVQIVEKENKEFKKLENIFDEIISGSNEVDRHGAYNSIPDTLVKRWKDYVQPHERWQKIRGFLYNFLDDYKNTHWIMDAATGIGIEYRFMQKDGFMMSANEYQDDMRIMGKEYFKKENEKIEQRDDQDTMAPLDIEYDATNHDWREMNKHNFRDKYGGILVIGNSLRTLQDRDGQQESVKIFYKMLREGGTLIIDERNYKRFLKIDYLIKQCETQPDDISKFTELKKFSYNPGNPMYHGDNLKAIPCMMDKDRGNIIFRYYDDSGTTHNMDEAIKKKIHEWEFLHADDMENILEHAGFTHVEKYMDYDLNKKIEQHEEANDASMFVYVAKKSKMSK